MYQPNLKERKGNYSSVKGSTATEKQTCKVKTTLANNLDKYHKTPKGYISVDPKEWPKLTDEENEAIQEFNVKLRETLK